MTMDYLPVENVLSTDVKNRLFSLEILVAAVQLQIFNQLATTMFGTIQASPGYIFPKCTPGAF